MFRLFNTKWIVFAFGYAMAKGDRHLGELEARPIRRGAGEVPSGLWLYSAEDIGGPAALVFVIPAHLTSWRCRRGWPHIGVQGDGLLIEAESPGSLHTPTSWDATDSPERHYGALGLSA